MFHLLLLMDAGLSNRPLVFGLRLLEAHDQRSAPQLHQFHHKFLATVKFGIDQVAKDNGLWRLSELECYYFKVYYVEGLGHNLYLPVGQFCDPNLEVAFSVNTHSIISQSRRHCVNIIEGLVPNRPPSTPFVPPSRSDWDLLFQPMFDESLNPLPYVDLQAPEVIAPIPEVVAPEHAVLTGSPSSTTVDQDAPLPSNSHTTQETQTPIISHNVEEDNHDIEVAYMGNDSYFGIPIPEVAFDQSLSSDVIHTIVPPDHQVSEHNSKCTKDHPLENIIGVLDRPVSTRLQLHQQAIFCYYDAFLTSVEPKNYKDALTQACWIISLCKRNFVKLNLSNDFLKSSVGSLRLDAIARGAEGSVVATYWVSTRIDSIRESLWIEFSEVCNNTLRHYAGVAQSWDGLGGRGGKGGGEDTLRDTEVEAQIVIAKTHIGDEIQGVEEGEPVNTAMFLDLEGGTNGVEGGRFGTSPELNVTGVIL
ncbi:hypothetical protein Tco_0937996 [Tanacetum coccineum]|uniref:Uncharacterized protein n=1 Tax=Tanacetum coccineum TaxID=301880 RepID=A0ABQ5DIM7_9ASTR